MTETETTPAALLYDAEQASKRLGTDSNGKPLVSAYWLRRKAAARRIPCTYLGKSPRWSERDLLDLLEQRRQVPPPVGRKPR